MFRQGFPLWYLLVHGVPKYLRLFEHVATFFFYNLTYFMYGSSHDKNNYHFLNFAFMR